MSKCVVVFSGGLDSTVLLSMCKEEMEEVIALNFNYGSKQNDAEKLAVDDICALTQVPLVTINLPFINELFDSPLLTSGEDIPDGCTEEGAEKKTVIVPFRNGIMLSIAIGYAESIGYDFVAIGNHPGNQGHYPDCSEEFIQHMNLSAKYGTTNGVAVYSPFVDKTKEQIIADGLLLGSPIELSYSCFKGGPIHCGVCAACLERKRAFKLAKEEDLTKYIN